MSSTRCPGQWDLSYAGWGAVGVILMLMYYSYLQVAEFVRNPKSPQQMMMDMVS
jgi:hypothetical protein